MVKSSSIHSEGKIVVNDEPKVRVLPVKECWVRFGGEDWHYFKPLVRDCTLILQGTHTHYFYMRGASI